MSVSGSIPKGSTHNRGDAFDVNVINGQRVGVTHRDLASFMSEGRLPGATVSSDVSQKTAVLATFTLAGSEQRSNTKRADDPCGRIARVCGSFPVVAILRQPLLAEYNRLRTSCRQRVCRRVENS